MLLLFAHYILHSYWSMGKTFATYKIHCPS